MQLQKHLFYLRTDFWRKFSLFLDGVYLSEEERRDLRVKITENGTKGENAFRLIEYIDRVETQKKIQYLVNATRCLLADFIDIATYFRICHAATYTLDEDLQFLKTHIEKSNLSYDTYEQRLLTAGFEYSCAEEPFGHRLFISLFGNALTLKKMDDIIKLEGGRAYGYKCIKRISRRNSCYF